MCFHISIEFVCWHTTWCDCIFQFRGFLLPALCGREDHMFENTHIHEPTLRPQMLYMPKPRTRENRSITFVVWFLWSQSRNPCHKTQRVISKHTIRYWCYYDWSLTWSCSDSMDPTRSSESSRGAFHYYPRDWLTKHTFRIWFWGRCLKSRLTCLIY